MSPKIQEQVCPFCGATGVCNTRNPVTSRTTGKLAFVHSSYSSIAPNPREFWLCNIIEETKTGQAGGCFLVEPLSRADRDNLRPLSRHTCTIVKHGHVKIIKPVVLTEGDDPILWILPLMHKHAIVEKDTVAVVVDLGGEMWREN